MSLFRSGAHGERSPTALRRPWCVPRRAASPRHATPLRLSRSWVRPLCGRTAPVAAAESKWGGGRGNRAPRARSFPPPSEKNGRRWRAPWAV